jgi:DNA-binding transcriptional MerR regulator
MIPAQPKLPEKLFRLKEAAEILSVTIDTLLEWNNDNILKPSISQNGEIGYSKKQLDKFLEIRRSPEIKDPAKFGENAFQEVHSQSTEKENKKLNDKRNTEINNSSSQIINTSAGKNISSANIFQNTPAAGIADRLDFNGQSAGAKRSQINNVSKNNLRNFEIISVYLILTILISAAVITQQKKFRNFISPNLASSQTSADPALQISDDKILVSGEIAMPIKNKILPGDNGIGNSKNSENILAFALPANENDNFAVNNNEHVPATPLNDLGVHENVQGSKYEDPLKLDSQVANYASRPNLSEENKHPETSVFDENGNLKGETDIDLLTANLGIAAMVQNRQPFAQTANQSVIVIVFSLGALSLFYTFRSKSAYIGDYPNPVQLTPDLPNSTLLQKIIEVNQKTDGTVVLYINDDEIKVSKPELNSESDQFIERLLSTSAKDSKEISYDILHDDIKLNAPLSKLVTRLGFVGLKRDLFFPRTSKTKVLFRRYITGHDLQAMGLTLDQISAELKN